MEVRINYDVYILQKNNNIVESKIMEHPFSGAKGAFVYPCAHLDWVTFNEDGSTDSKQYPSWKYIKPL